MLSSSIHFLIPNCHRFALALLVQDVCEEDGRDSSNDEDIALGKTVLAWGFFRRRHLVGEDDELT